MTDMVAAPEDDIIADASLMQHDVVFKDEHVLTSLDVMPYEGVTADVRYAVIPVRLDRVK
jgi:hypothetical protein